MTKTITGILGGTFDPVHNGHLHIAKQILQHPEVDKVAFMPCNIPVLKTPPTTTTAQRLEMLKLALQQYPNMQIEKCEIERGGISYMADTLKHLTERSSQSIALILGTDTFNNLNKWHNWPQILENAHIIIVPRPGYSISDADWAKQALQNRTTDMRELGTSKSGKIFILTMALMPISSTEIRAKHKHNLPKEGVPDNVQDYISKNNLYL